MVMKLWRILKKVVPEILMVRAILGAMQRCDAHNLQ